MSDAPQSLEAIAAELDAMASSIGFSGNSVLACNLRDKAYAIRSHAQKQSEDTERLDWLLGRSSFGQHVLDHPHQTHVSFESFFTLRIQVFGRAAIDDAMQNREAIEAIDSALRSESKGGQG